LAARMLLLFPFNFFLSLRSSALLTLQIFECRKDFFTAKTPRTTEYAKDYLNLNSHPSLAIFAFLGVLAVHLFGGGSVALRPLRWEFRGRC